MYVIIYGIFSYCVGLFVMRRLFHRKQQQIILDTLQYLLKHIQPKEVIPVVNLNILAKKITLSEGLKKSVSIAQVKEIMKLVFTAMKHMSLEEIGTILKRYT